jgi:CRP/FNR family cyclic AMP-dependent transcriptional regulator
MPTSKAAPRNALDHPALTESVRALARRGEVRSYRKGTLLIQEGDVGDTIYVILSGRLRTFGSVPGGDREITYGNYGAGEYVGEMGLDGGPRSASVIVVETSICAVINRPTLETYLAENPAFAFDLIAKLIRRARAATFSAKQLALNDVYGRLRLMLESVAEPQADGTRCVREWLTHRDLASRLGCSREMVSRVLKDLESGGHISVAADHRISWRQLPARW